MYTNIKGKVMRLGIDEVKDVVRLGCSMGNAISKSLEDGQFNLGDLTNFIDPAMKIPAAVEGFDLVDDQLLDMDDQEQAELQTMVQEEFNIPSAKAEEIVDRSFNFGMAGIRLYQAIVAPPEVIPEEPPE